MKRLIEYFPELLEETVNLSAKRVSNDQYAIVDFAPENKNVPVVATSDNPNELKSAIEQQRLPWPHRDKHYLKVVRLRAPVYVGDTIDRRRASALSTETEHDEAYRPAASKTQPQVSQAAVVRHASKVRKPKPHPE